MATVETINQVRERAIAWGPVDVDRTVDAQECHDQFLAEHGEPIARRDDTGWCHELSYWVRVGCRLPEPAADRRTEIDSR